MLTWNIEHFKRNKTALHFFIEQHQPDFAFISEPMLFQCDLSHEMNQFGRSYFSSLNSLDLYDSSLPFKSSRAFGGTMILWKEQHDPFVTVVPSSSSAFLPIIFEPPDLPITIHVAVYLPTAGQDSEFANELSNLHVCIEELQEKHPDVIIYLRGDFNASSENL